MRLGTERSVALVLDACPTHWTSFEEFHYRLALALKSRGVPVCITYSDPVAARVEQTLVQAGIPFYVHNWWKEGWPTYARNLGGIFRKHQVALVQSRGFNHSMPVWWSVRSQGVKRMIFVEGNSGLLNGNGAKKRLLGLRARLYTAPVTHTVAVSDFVRAQLLNMGFPAERVTRIHNGVRLERYHPDAEGRRSWRHEYGISEDETVVSTISYLRAFKNPQVVLESVAELRKRGLPVRLVVAGNGELLEPMQKLSCDLGISNQVIWLGDYGRTEQLLQASDVFVMASTGEAFGYVLIEAAGSGVPCVASRSGAFPEIVRDGETGYLAEPLNAASFADAISKLVEDEPKRRRMGVRARECALESFGVDGTVERFLELYERLPD
jgi:glycosyltransferase involved in cell wall biosynthesis